MFLKVNKQVTTYLFCIVASIVLFSSCKNDDDPLYPSENFPNTTVAVQADSNYTILNAAIVKAGISGVLNEDKVDYSITLFAPTNNAFRAINIDATLINNLTPQQVDTFLRPLLLYHVGNKKLLQTALPVSDTLKSVSGKYLFASRNANGTFVNAAKIIATEVYVSNGVMHGINAVLMPPSKTIMEIVNGNASFSLLKTAIQKSGLTTTLSQAGKYTVFAPVNAGFPAALDNSTKINAADSVAVLGIVGSHFFTTNIFSSDLIACPTSATYNPAKTLTVSIAPNATVKITGSANTAATITTPNIIATNGVVHIINTLLQ